MARFYVLSATANFIFSTTMTIYSITQGYSDMAVMFSVMTVLSVAEWCVAYGNYLRIDVYGNAGSATIECVPNDGKVEAGDTGTRKYMSGKDGECEIANLFKGESQVYFKTSKGGRFVDQLADGIAHESKVGYTSLSKRIKIQILKDVELINTGQINGAHWHFFTSGVTGKGGASKPLLDFLSQNGIEYTIH